jgi:LppP/LprE lipoprotein
MRRVTILVLLSASLGVVGPAVAGQVSVSAGPSRSTALAYAKRTFIVVPGVGNVPFKLGAQTSVTAKDGSTITAFSITNDYGGTADSTHSAVMLFHGGHFLGWASSRAAMFLTFEPSSGNAIRVSYPVWKATDPTCCPSGRTVVSYDWNGSRIVARGQPPLIYGRPGILLHLGSG